MIQIEISWITFVNFAMFSVLDEFCQNFKTWMFIEYRKKKLLTKNLVLNNICKSYYQEFNVLSNINRNKINIIFKFQISLKNPKYVKILWNYPCI